MSVFNFTTTDTTFTLVHNGINRGTWNKIDEIDNEQLHLVSFYIHDDHFTFSLKDAYYNQIIFSTDTVIHNGVTQGGTVRSKVAYLKDNVFYLPVEVGEGGGGDQDLQGVIDVSNILTKANQIILDQNFLNITGGNRDYEGEWSDVQIGHANTVIGSSNANGNDYSYVDVASNLGVILQSTDGTNIKRLTVDADSVFITTNGIAKPVTVLLLTDNFADDAAAATGGVPVGGLYHTSGTVKVRLT